MKKYQLMAPGPTPVPSQVLLAMAQPMIHHRTLGYATEPDVVIALATLEQILADLGIPVDFGAGARAAQKIFSEKP